MRTRRLFILSVFSLLLGCYAGSVKPLVNQPQFQKENLPIRTLRVLVVTDNTFRRDDIERLVKKCSDLAEMQAGIRLAIWEWYPIRWGEERNDVWRMLIRMAEDTWDKRDDFDLAVGFSYFEYWSEPGKLMLGAIDGFFWRYIVVRELDPQIFLHELFHACLPGRNHSDEWAMRGEKHVYGGDWFWLRPEERKEILRNKWRDFDLMPTSSKEGQRKSSKAEFYSRIGLVFLEDNKLNAAFFFFDRAIEFDRNLSDGYVGRGMAFLKMVRYDRAVSELTKAIEIDPRHSLAYGLRGVAYGAMGEYEQAMEDGRKGVELDNQSGEAYFCRGLIYYSKKEYEKAWEDVGRARKLGFKIPAEFLAQLQKASGRKK